jgi:hypothetical protein
MLGRRWVLGLACAVAAMACVATGLALAASRTGVSGSFQPWDSSFLSATSGFVLGGRGCQLGLSGAQQPCKAVVVATSDAGASWRELSAPSTLLQPTFTDAGGSTVKAITFADARDGWLYSPSLWATHDAGAHWTRIQVKGLVVSVVATGGWAYAAVDESTGLGAEGPALLRSPVGRDDWQPVSSLAGVIPTADGSSQLAAAGGTVWAATVPTPVSTSAPVLWRSVDGAPWERLGNPCATRALQSLTASSASDLVMLCASPGESSADDGDTGEIATSTDGGVHTQLAPAAAGNALGSIAAPLNTSQTVVFAYPLPFVSDVVLPPIPGSWLDRTAHGGGAWTRSLSSDRGVGWTALQFSSPTVGWVIHGYPGSSIDQLLRTTDAGTTFSPVHF